jgi:hypothetical protein
MKTLTSILLLQLILVFFIVSGYITNAIWLFKHFSAGITLETIISLVGVVAAPLGVLHGLYLWF